MAEPVSGEESKSDSDATDGELHRTRSWTTEREGELSWSGTVALAPEQLARLEVVGGDGRRLVTLPG